MVSFKFTKKNGIAPVGAVRKVNPALAKVYSKIGLGSIIEEAKEVPKKGKKTKTK